MIPPPTTQMSTFKNSYRAAFIFTTTLCTSVKSTESLTSLFREFVTDNDLRRGTRVSARLANILKIKYFRLTNFCVLLFSNFTRVRDSEERSKSLKSFKETKVSLFKSGVDYSF